MRKRVLSMMLYKAITGDRLVFHVTRTSGNPFTAEWKSYHETYYVTSEQAQRYNTLLTSSSTIRTEITITDDISLLYTKKY